MNLVHLIYFHRKIESVGLITDKCMCPLILDVPWFMSVGNEHITGQ